MESEIKKQPRRKIAPIVLVSIILLFLVYYSVMSMISPSRKLAELKKAYSEKSSEKNNTSKLINKDPDYLKLLKEKAYLQSRIAMAGTDSSYLALNMADSSANIEICGIVVHKAKMSTIKVSKILSRTDEDAILSLFASPFTVASSFATIMKEPIIFQMAPKDTSEYKPDIMPDTTIAEPVNYILETDQGVRIYLYQEESMKMNDRINQFKFDLNDRIRDTWNALKSIAVLKVPEYHLYIKIKLPRADAKIIYRALPKNGQIAFFY
jgi:hypothetical protein